MAKTTTAADLRSSNLEDLTEKLSDAKAELFNLRFQSATGQLENTARIRQIRREIARIFTIIRERELGIIEEDV